METAPTFIQKFEFLSGGGEMGALTRTKDWSKTPLGHPETWPQSLRTTVSIVLHSKFPMFLWWGPELICFYNDAYRPSLGENGKHPHILGQSAEEAWPEIWSIIKPLIDQVLAGGEATWSEDQLIPIFRNGKIEDVYWTFSYSPVLDESSKVAGILVTCSETTGKVNALKVLEESNRRYFKDIMQAPVAMCFLRGKDHVVEIANEKMLEVWGKTAEQVMNKHLFVGLPEVRGQGFEELLNHVYTTGEKFVAHERPVNLPRNHTIETTYIDFTYQALSEPDGTISGVVVIATDVTFQVVARKKVEESEERFRSFVESAPFPIGVYIGKEMRIQLVNQAILDVWGKGQHVTGQKYAEVLPELEGSGIYEQLDNVFTTGIPFHAYYQQVKLMINNELKPHYFNYSFTPLFDITGTVYGVMNTAAEVTDLVIAKQKVEESEKRFRNVADSAPVLIWMADSSKLRTFFNTAWLQFTNCTMEQEMGNSWSNGIHPEDAERCLSYYTAAFDKREEFYMEYRLKRYDGQYRWISEKGVPRFTSDGIFEGYIGACMDIHEKAIYEKKLKEDEERLNIIINASELGTWELNVKSKEVYYSDRYLQILGYSERVDLTHQQILSHLHLDDLPARDAAFKKALGTGMLHYESRIIWNDKSLHWIEGKGKVFYDENNEPEKLIGTVRDITEEKYFQQELLDREQKFRLLADSMPEFVWTGDAKGNLNYFNQSVYKYSGLSPEQLNKDKWIQIVHPEDRDENINRWNYAVSTGTDFLFEHRFRRYDGEYRWQLSRATPQKDSAGNIQMWVGTSTDIQEIKELDHQKDLFISIASHELKTPVTSIKGYVQLLLARYSENADPFLKTSLLTVDKQIVTLTRLISDLLDLSKIKSGNLFLNKEHFQVTLLIEEIIDEIAHINPDYNFVFSGEKEIIVHADRERIGQVLRNLLTNAIKYSPVLRTVKIECTTTATSSIISVADSGIGISRNDQQKIFERFYRVEGKNEKTFPGFGIGLFICAEIINRHSGTIGVTSEPGKGSVFYFSLPLHNQT